jgi:hypothetical protein
MKKLLINCSFLHYSRGLQKIENFAVIISINEHETDFRFLIIQKLEELNFNLGEKILDKDYRLENLLRFTAQPF